MQPYQLLQRVQRHFSGARGHFVRARLQLKTGIDIDAIDEEDRDPDIADRLLKAIEEICPEVLK